MDCIDILLGHPWHYDVNATHKGRSNTDFLNWNGIRLCSCQVSAPATLTLLHPQWLFLWVCSDTEGFVIPSLTVEDSDLRYWDEPKLNDLRPPPKSTTTKEEEKIYLGPHGAPPSQAKQQDPSAAGRKQRLKQKLKEADHKYSGTGRENKADTIRELVGNKMVTKTVPKNSQREWLDPHCHESYFERYSQ
ncbi:hypothetical protein KSP40_PGU019733 [Platanthera guangdongensis]|uniref:Uncharacterized protein n=1 Tax=Platanthera guangdongensis TaxID=2320717 RepID=A0ABR2LJQ0_9ASPA